jgi:uncharacterized protein (TIGR03118 family)
MHHQLLSHRSLTAIIIPSILAFAVATGCGGDDDSSTGSGGTGGSGAKGGKGGAAGKAGAAGRGGTAGATTAGNGGRGGSSGGGGKGGSAGSTATGGTGARGGTGNGNAGEAGNAGQPSGAGAGGEGGAGGAMEIPGSGLVVVRTDLVTDAAGGIQDPNLINAWGLAINPISTGALFWVSAADKGLATVYDQNGTVQSLVVTIPSANGTDTGSPTGQVFNSSTDFMGDKFIFATEDGLIEGWQTGTDAVMRADRSAEQASYKGIALVTSGATHTLAAANFHAGTVDVFDASYTRVTTAGLFEDPNLPSGYAPFNIAELGGSVYVTYAKQDADKADDVSGLGNGYVNEFSPDGTFTKRLISRGLLDSPWGLALAPASFGTLSNMLLVGNFGNGRIHAYDPANGAEMGVLTNGAGTPLDIDGLWSLSFGPNTTASDLTGVLFFTAGPGDEMHGVFGQLIMP